MIQALSNVTLKNYTNAAADWRQLSSVVQGEVPIQVYFVLAAQLVTVNGATNDGTAAQAEFTAGRSMYYPAGIVYQMFCDPSRTWVRQNTASGADNTAFVFKQS
jgi:hypothetical protein